MELNTSLFGVPCVVADNFLKLASEAQIKVLLYTLRHSDSQPNISDISANTGVSPQEAEDALLFWKQVNVLTSPVPDAPLKPMAAPQSEALPTQQDTPAETSAVNAKRTASASRKPDIPPSEIADRMSSSQEISELFKMAQDALGPLNHHMQTSLLWMHDHLGLRTEVIITLIYYCVKIDKPNSAYIERLASVWAENEINSLSAAEDEIQRLERYRTYSGQIEKKFELIRRPTAKQAEFIKKWQDESISLELIGYAYEKTIEQINKLNFNYIDKILMTWKQSGFASVKEVCEAEQSFKSSRNAAAKADIGGSDIDKYKVVINKF